MKPEARAKLEEVRQRQANRLARMPKRKPGVYERIAPPPTYEEQEAKVQAILNDFDTDWEAYDREVGVLLSLEPEPPKPVVPYIAPAYEIRHPPEIETPARPSSPLYGYVMAVAGMLLAGWSIFIAPEAEPLLLVLAASLMGFGRFVDDAGVAAYVLVALATGFGLIHLGLSPPEEAQALRTAQKAACERTVEHRRIEQQVVERAGYKVSLSVPDCAKLVP